MKDPHKNRIHIKVFLFALFFSLIALNGFADEKQGPEDTAVKIKAGKERLVARDIGGKLPFWWCGSTAFLIYGNEFGTEWIDFNGKTVTISTNGSDYPVGCTPDGKWVFYDARDSWRIDKGRQPPEDPGMCQTEWEGYVMDMYRYEVDTGRRQKFAVVRDRGVSGIVSPDGSKIFLGGSHNSAIEVPEPKWEAVWLAHEWDHFSTRWFPDSSGIVTKIWGNGSSLGVEFFGEEKWSKEFSLDRLKLGPGINFFLAAVDENKGLHFFTIKGYPEADSSRNIYSFYRCKIRQRNLICSFTGEITEEADENILSLDLLPNEDIIFKREEDNCIRRVRARGVAAECIADTRYGDDVYLNIDLEGISPDGRWMAIRRGKLPPETGGGSYVYQYDLFVIELEND